MKIKKLLIVAIVMLAALKLAKAEIADTRPTNGLVIATSPFQLRLPPPPPRPPFPFFHRRHHHVHHYRRRVYRHRR